MDGNKKVASVYDEQRRVARSVSVLLTGSLLIAFCLAAVTLGCLDADAGVVT